jgi:hypothetical protein
MTTKDVISTHPSHKRIATADLLSLREFTLSFFEEFGAQILPSNDDGDDPIVVILPLDLEKHFGKRQLNLVFQNAEVTSETDLVAYGSRVFDRIMAYLERQGTVLVHRLPVRFSGADMLLQAVRPMNAAIADVKMAQRDYLLLLFNWHITFRADDKREEIYPVLIDETGKRLPLAIEPGDGGLDLEQLLADAEPIPPEVDADGQPTPAKLPPMTHLVRWAETARKYALYHADVGSVAHEAEILPRLHKVLARLTTYYEQQIQEVYDTHDPTGEKRRSLEEDLQRKIAEEIENHRLRVQVRLFSYGVFRLPVATADLTVSDGQREAPVRITRNLYTGALRRPTCQSCAREVENLVLCRNGHISCDDCMVQCQHCQDVLCAECGVEACPVCGQLNCDTCGQTCWVCGQRACPEHISTCPVCGDTVCLACQDECSACGSRQCRSHLRADHVTGEPICHACAVRCPGCQQYSAHVDTCSASGQRFCTDCLKTCAGCGKKVGPGFYHVDTVDDQPYCSSCLQPCPSCGVLVGALSERACTVCEEPCCGACGMICSECHTLVCKEHGHRCTKCYDTLCPDHVNTCSVGGEILCSACAEPCAICEELYCVEHVAVCASCGQAYCQSCVDDPGWCRTCQELAVMGHDVSIQDEPIIADPRLANMAGKYRWRKQANHRFTLYLGSNLWGMHVLVVAENEQIVRIRRSTIWSRLFDAEWP